MRAQAGRPEVGSAVVTGGARGIGRGIAERMVARGHAVVVTDVDGEAAARTAAEIGAAAGLAQDVRDAAGHAAAAAEAARHGELHRVVQQRRRRGRRRRSSELSEEAVRRLVEVNVLGTLWGMRAAVAAFGAAGGDIVNTASLAGLGPVPGYSVYAATKAAVVSATDVGATPRRRAGCGCTRCAPTACRPRCSTARPATGSGAALVHSGGRILTGRRGRARGGRAARQPPGGARLPGWRGGLVRAAAVAPSLPPAAARRCSPPRGGARSARRALTEAPSRVVRTFVRLRGLCRSNTCSTVVHMFDRTSDRVAGLDRMRGTVGGHR